MDVIVSEAAKAVHIANLHSGTGGCGISLPSPKLERAMIEKTNDNAAASSGGESWRGLEPHGEAALLLSESLLHGLIAASLITVRQAAGIVSNAVEVSQELADVNGLPPAGDTSSLALLTAIRSSLAFDLPDG